MTGGLRPMRYAVIRVVPDPIRDEPVNVGIVLQDVQTGAVVTRVVRSVDKIRTYTGEDVDTVAVQFAIDAIQEAAAAPHREPDFLSKVLGQHTQLVQLSPASGSLGSDPEDEAETLFGRLVSLEARGKKGKQGQLTRKKLLSRVRLGLFERQVDAIQRHRLAGELGSFVFDFGLERDNYRSLQCVSLAGAVEEAAEEAKVLAYSVKDIQNRGRKLGERRIAGLTLTTILAPPPRETEATGSVRAILRDVGEVRDSETEFQAALASFAGA